MIERIAPLLDAAETAKVAGHCPTPMRGPGFEPSRAAVCAGLRPWLAPKGSHAGARARALRAGGIRPGTKRICACRSALRPKLPGGGWEAAGFPSRCDRELNPVRFRITRWIYSPVSHPKRMVVWLEGIEPPTSGFPALCR